MWCDVQSPAMMGLQATASKRKLEYDNKCPSKVVRLEESAREAAVEDWHMDNSTSSVLASSLLGAASAVAVVDDDDEEEEDEEDEEEDEKNGKYLPAGRGYQCARYGGADMSPACYSHPVDLKPMPTYYGASEEQGYSGASMSQYNSRPQQHYATTARNVPQYWGASAVNDGGNEYYSQDSGSQQTIRCDENGKSYLDLGSSSARYVNSAVSNNNSGASPDVQKCCDGSRTSWCNQGPNAACYRQRRLAVLNISMCKLGRYRQFPDPSLHRSVLICNTLRYIEREMEQEGFFFNNANSAIQTPPPPVPPPAPTPHPPIEPEPSYHSQFPEVPAPNMSYSSSHYRLASPVNEIVPPYEQNLRELSSSGRATPFPGVSHSSNYDTDSGMGDEESGRGINWGSVLSLSSQSDLDPLNNNELYPSSPSHSSSSSMGLGPSDNNSLGLLGDMDLGHEFDDFLPSWKLTPLSADDILKSVPSSELGGRQGEGELDSIMHVLVGT
ncbi:hypothetical protein R5R35_004522 [Gryllus longicercus]|uniref:SERTA domain-containing protein n=2 Tax=Gryllus longicercus TaxID=2509291 RepID=A0AAN9ZES1_9ORTH